jgi:hypothetical protein
MNSMKNSIGKLMALATISGLIHAQDNTVHLEDDELIIPFNRNPPLMGYGTYMEESKGAKIDIDSINVTAGRDILIHNKEQLHTFTIHGVEIQAPNKKAAIKIYNRKYSKNNNHGNTNDRTAG